MRRFTKISSKYYVVIALVAAVLSLTASSAYATSLSPFTLSGYDADVMYGVDGGNGGGYCINPAYKNNAFAFFANGAKTIDGTQYATGGLPLGNFTSALDATNTYGLAYAGGVAQSDNALRIQGAYAATGNSGSLDLVSPGYFDQIGVLACSFEGSNAFSSSRGKASPDLVVTLNFSDNSTWSSTYHAWDWCDTSHSSEVGFSCSAGRAYGTFDLDGNFTNVDAHYPNLYETVIDIPALHQSKELESITFYGVCGTEGSSESYMTDCGTLIFAISGHSAVVPEPSSLALLACGLIGLLAYAWKKRK